ncbi:MAG: pilus assembly protein N-terminal domain-containing protein [Asticcacaulis sp.]
MRKLILTGAAIVMMAAGAASAGQRVVIEKNHTQRVSLNAPAGSVIVGNPAIADVTVVDSRTIYIVGKDYGRSAITITDRSGRTIWDGDISVGTPIKGGVTVYKGVKASTVICANVCYEQTEGQFSVGGQ